MLRFAVCCSSKATFLRGLSVALFWSWLVSLRHQFHQAVERRNLRLGGAPVGAHGGCGNRAPSRQPRGGDCVAKFEHEHKLLQQHLDSVYALLGGVECVVVA